MSDLGGAGGPRIVLGSTSPVKLAALRAVARELLPRASVAGVAAASGVSSQPASEVEALRGARARAEAVRGIGDVAVGIESGVAEIEGRWFGCTWAAVIAPDGELEVASSARYPLTDAVALRVLAGVPLERAAGVRSGTGGAVGALTGGAVSRYDLTAQALRIALARLARSEGVSGPPPPFPAPPEGR
jgi:inosine/xanthosine triphosphatase